MRINRTITIAAAAIAIAASVAACGAKPAGPKDGDPITGGPPSALAGTSAGTLGRSGEQPAPDSPVSPEEQAAGLSPAAARAFLESEGIPSGDIYLGEGGLLHINIVELNEEIEGRFAEIFSPFEYKLVDVRYTYEELERAQEALITHDLMRKHNIYASAIDVIGNRLEITMPDSSEGAQAEIEKHIDPGMIAYHIQPLGDTPLAGTIYEIDKTGGRLLILVDGEEEPSYWLSFNEFSMLTDASGAEIGFDAFTEGEKVRVWTAGAVLTSMPAQATARKIELVE